MNYCFLYTITTGAIYGTPYFGETDEWTNIPSGCALLGPFNETIANATVKDAFVHQSYYLVQSGALVTVSNLAQLQLQDAQTTKTTDLQKAYSNALKAGFLSLASGTSQTYGFDDVDQTNLSQQLNIVNAALATYPIQWGTKGGTAVVSLTDAQFKQLCKDANDFKWVQVNNLRAKVANVNATTNVTAVNAIVW